VPVQPRTGQESKKLEFRWPGAKTPAPIGCRTFVRVQGHDPSEPDLPPERLPCPACHRLTTTHPVYTGVEVVSCDTCGKLLRRRPALDPQQRAQAQILRWAVQQIEATMSTRHRRKPRGGSDEVFEQGMARVLDQLLDWSRVIHKIAPLREPSDS
jgi:hypothetical protein